MHLPIKKLNISTLETKVSEEVALQSEELVDNQAISTPKSLGNSTWECIVNDNNLHFTTTLIVKADHLKEFNCNCNNVRDNNICPHVVSSIITLRKFIYDHAQTAAKQNVKKRIRRRQDISQLINLLPHEDLSEFVIAKSRSDKNFRLLVQAYFIEHLPSDQLETLIESTFPVLTKANERVSPSKLNFFIEISKDLQAHFKSLLSQENLIEGYKLAYLHLKKSFYIKHYLNNENQKFFKLHNDLVSNFLEVYNLIEAPEYRLIILEQLEDLLEASYISASLAIEQKIWLLLLRSEGSKDKLDYLCQNYFDRHRREDFETYYFLKMLTILVEMDLIKLEQKVAKMSTQEAYRIIHLLGKHLDIHEAQIALHFFYIKRNLNHPLSKFIANKLTIIENFRKELVEKTILYFKLYKDIEYIPYLEYFSKNSKTTPAKVIKIAEESNNLNFIIDVNLFLGKTDKAIDLLKKNISWELLVCFDKKIIEIDEDQCYELYKLSLFEYLKDHFGIHSKSFVSDVFHRAKHIGLGYRSSDLKKELHKTFPSRKLIR